MAAAGTQRALQQLGQTVNPSPRLPGAALLTNWTKFGLDPNSTFQAHYPNPIDDIFGQPAPYIPPPAPPPSPASQQQQMLNSIAATNPDLANAIAAKLGISYAAPTHGPTIGPTTFTQNITGQGPNVAGSIGGVPLGGGGPVGGGAPISIDPAAPLGSDWGQPPWWPVRVQDPPGPPIQPLPPGTDLGVLSAQRRRR